MKQMEEKTEDPSDIYRGDQCLKPTKPLLLFVHVGKTCGSSVMQALRNPQNQAAMRRLAPGHEPFDAVHMHPVRREVTDSMSRVLITLRDPVDRFISSYNTAATPGDSGGTVLLKPRATGGRAQSQEGQVFSQVLQLRRQGPPQPRLYTEALGLDRVLSLR